MFGDGLEERHIIIREQVLCSLQDVLSIPSWMLPMPVLAFNPFTFFSFATGVKTHGQYGHFMWLISKNEFASQSWWFERVPVIQEDGTTGHYGSYILKFWYNPTWTVNERALLTKAIRKDLDRPWWQTVYDVPQLFGHLVGLKWIQLPGLEVCSDRADYFKLVDGVYTLKRPTPTDVNLWMQGLPWNAEKPEKSGYVVGFRFLGKD